ncbi:EDD domain protein, DegV family [Pseudobutyrivibrio sp. UC1225]|uniref:DegV family protein n=1 Tax=Pseudobutyrivibrio sp. UC1225 TaxID=1798185 RepID=UPI0008F3416B|nr:DegV family protein [Pseudobutyrivibrio sp. UC1225]SFO17041.1 EDD domain protein, DegV family [Pseudobutyrivibrio sp. UC1225]
MGDYIISCCSTVDVTEEYLKEKNIEHICFHYYLDDVAYTDDLFKSMSATEFYQAMTDGAMTRTSQVNADEFTAYFRGFLEQGKDIIHLTLSGGISGVINSARIAAQELQEEFPDRKIVVFDSLTASAGYALMMDKLASLRDEGYDFDRLVNWANGHIQNQNTWFFTTDLTFFIRGGRVSKVSGWFGTALNICPLLNINDEGKLCPRQKCRGKKMVKRAALEAIKARIDDGEKYSENIFITHSVCYDDAREMADMLEFAFPHMKEKIRIFDIGPTIGSHTGPGTVAIGFWGSLKEH